MFFVLWLGDERHELVDAGLKGAGLLQLRALGQAILTAE